MEGFESKDKELMLDQEAREGFKEGHNMIFSVSEMNGLSNRMMNSSNELNYANGSLARRSL